VCQSVLTRVCDWSILFAFALARNILTHYVICEASMLESIFGKLAFDELPVGLVQTSWHIETDFPREAPKFWPSKTPGSSVLSVE